MLQTSSSCSEGSVGSRSQPGTMSRWSCGSGHDLRATREPGVLCNQWGVITHCFPYTGGREPWRDNEMQLMEKKKIAADSHQQGEPVQPSRAAMEAFPRPGANPWTWVQSHTAESCWKVQKRDNRQEWDPGAPLFKPQALPGWSFKQPPGRTLG